MRSRGRLEAEITERLSRLSAEDMQRVAEDYARIRHPQRFPHFDFRAFSPEGKTRKGWPDAWVCLDGRKDGVEATGDKSKSGVEQHLRDDLAKAIAQDPPLAGLILVSGSPAVQPTDDEIADWRRPFIDDAGIPAENLQLVFGPGLIADLVRPEFARTRVEVLCIRDIPAHFRLIRPRSGPDEGRLNSAFIPSEDDYAKGRVYRPALADQVLAELDQHGRALIRGVGASGKTVLAWLLGLEAAEQRRPAFYLDLANYADAGGQLGNALIDDLHRFAHPDTLFIIDNCHLDEPLAKQIALGWEDLFQDQRPRMLLVGRELRTTRGSPIDGLSLPTLALRARQAEVLGVYRRLAARYASGSKPPEPPSDVVDAWVRTFGGDPNAPDTTTDLIAFSVALLRRTRRVLAGDWALTARDAADEVRDAYLDKLSEGEKHNLIRLCACQEIEAQLPQEALADPYAGLRTCERRSGLVFSGEVGRFGEYKRYRFAHAALAQLIVTARGPSVSLRRERLAMAQQYPFVSQLFLWRLHMLGSEGEATEIARTMLAQPNLLLEMGALNWLYGFCLRVKSIEVPLPPQLGEVLTNTDNRERLTERALETPLHFLVNFLDHAARTDQLKPVFDALAADLAAPENRGRLAERALETPLDSLASFLGYAARTDKLRPIFKALPESLRSAQNLRKLSSVMARSPLDAIVSVMRSDNATELWLAAFSEIDLEIWNQSMRGAANQKLDAFVAFQRIAFEKNRIELTHAPALALVERSMAAAWHQSTIGLRHLSHVVRLAVDASPTQIDAFLARVATPKWLDGLYGTVSAGALAGSLFSFGRLLDLEKSGFLRRPTLGQRLRRELQTGGNRKPELDAQAIALLGACKTIGITINEKPHIRSSLRKLLVIRQPSPDLTAIGTLQIQFWLGLRELARLRRDAPPVPPELVQPILDLWMATAASDVDEGLPPPAQELDAEMISWLEHCRAAGWRLVPPDEEFGSGGDQPEP